MLQTKLKGFLHKTIVIRIVKRHRKNWMKGLHTNNSLTHSSRSGIRLDKSDLDR